MTLEDFAFLQTVLNFGTILLTAIVISWTRHGEPENEQTIGEPSRLVQFLYRVEEPNYMGAMQTEDELSEVEKAAIARMVTDRAALSFRGAQAHGIGRASWNRIRAALINMGLADQTPAGDLLLNSSALEYLRIEASRE